MIGVFEKLGPNAQLIALCLRTWRDPDGLPGGIRGWRSSSSSLLGLSPVILGVGIAVALAMDRPVLFRQTRPGLDGRLFALRKFRTMHPVGPDRVSDEDRLSRLGRWLQGTTADGYATGPEFLDTAGSVSLTNDDRGGAPPA